MTRIASSRVAIVVGGLPSTRRAESPRPIPRSIRPPETSLRTASADAVTDGSRVAGLVTQVPSRSRLGRLGHEGQQHVRLAPQHVRVEQPAVVEAGVLRLAGQGERALEGVIGLERETELHGCRAPQSFAGESARGYRVPRVGGRGWDTGGQASIYLI